MKSNKTTDFYSRPNQTRIIDHRVKIFCIAAGIGDNFLYRYRLTDLHLSGQTKLGVIFAGETQTSVITDPLRQFY